MKANGDAVPQKGRMGIKELVKEEYVIREFQKVLQEKASAFLASVISATNRSPQLAGCKPKDILASAMIAAQLDLPIDSNLGFAAIVPYKDKNGNPVAQFQIMYKGFIQLAMRTGQYETINVVEIYEDELKHYDLITGAIKVEYVPNGFRENGKEDKIIGYAAHFSLINGYKKTEYWPLGKIQSHGKKYSKSFGNQYGLWKTNPHAMYSKTVLKNMISKWGILSTVMQKAIIADQATAKSLEGGIDQDNLEYFDNAEETIDAPVEKVLTGEYKPTKEESPKKEKASEKKMEEYEPGPNPFDDKAEEQLEIF